MAPVFFLSISIFILINLFSIKLKKSYLATFFTFFRLQSVFSIACLAAIELVSEGLRPFVMGLRLFINTLSGHIIIKILLIAYWVSFYLNYESVYYRFTNGFAIGLIYSMDVIFTFVQAYVFILMATVLIVHALTLNTYK